MMKPKPFHLRRASSAQCHGFSHASRPPHDPPKHNFLDKCLLYLPPYSPDFNPIEQAWSKLKQRLRGVKARVLDQLEPAIAQALSAVTAQNARAFFRHCGYGIQQL